MMILVMLHADCMEGYGKFADEPAQNPCHLCMRGTYNDASSFDPVTGAERASASCLVCTPYQYEYPYATQLIAMGHLSARIMPVDSNITTYRPGATSESECLPASYQLVSWSDASSGSFSCVCMRSANHATTCVGGCTCKL